MKVLLKRRNALLSTKIWKYLFSKTFQGVRNLENIHFQTIMCKNYWENCEKWPSVASHKQFKKTLLRANMVKLKIISLYIYKDLRLKTEDLRSNKSRDHYHGDGNVVPSPRCGFSFEASFQLWGLKLTLFEYIRNATFR